MKGHAFFAYATSRLERKEVEILVAHLKRILSLSGCDYARQTAPGTSFHLAAAAKRPSKLINLLPKGPHVKVA